jgi:4-aminobutyrate aminotransferase-like enzyme
MDRAWPAATGEAIHTSTFLGHPVGCAMALAQIGEIRRLNLPRRSAEQGRLLLRLLTADLANVAAVFSIRGLGLIAGVELRENNSPASKLALGTIKRMLQRGFILLPEGEASNVISLTPPLTISSTQLCSALKALAVTLHSIR